MSATAVNLGSILLRQEKTGEAIDVLATAASLQPDDAAAHGALGLAYFTAGNLPAAERSFRKTVEYDDRNPRHRHNLGSATAATGRFSEARAVLEEAREVIRNYLAGHPQSLPAQQMLRGLP